MTQAFAYLLAVATFAAPLSLPSPGHAAEADYLKRFSGSWSGSGTVQRDAAEDPNRVRCSMRGSPSENEVSISGTCRAAVVFSRKISADLRFDPGSKRYTGTYTGSVIGPAKLSGSRRGDAVVLTITWPKPVNGDRTATMTIRNDGGGQLGITVMDEAPDGGNAKVTDLALSQN
jgi:hypothetical protein